MSSITSSLLLLLLLLAAASLTHVIAADPDMLQDLCVADLNSAVRVNGFPCKPATNVSASDFFFSGLARPGATNTTMGSVVTRANVEQIPGLNTLGISMTRVDYAPGGLNPPHVHPRASEIVFVLAGEIEVGFVTTANRLVGRTIGAGEVFVFPRGLVHWQRNVGSTPAAAVAAFNSQLPGSLGVAAALFASEPAVADEVLERAFQIGAREVRRIRRRLAPH
ncbi:germin-like protein subfamily 2 member 2 [Zingiber officinale]|uniref:Cupin type-1 domain-containing protein n=1 Tax=Zingiber officinale TaxID=94328 RepID=A0A8J5F8K5_ZINOF|nr:germin-like protein subfamily 2 member 2 [Zingiber officinale]KAG6481648.1 hypothetical protein ZIOFF_058252 [Zingiber officinale]